MNQTPFNAAAPTATTDASYVFNVLILDESGSMGSIASAAKEVFEGYLHRLIQEQQDIPDLMCIPAKLTPHSGKLTPHCLRLSIAYPTVKVIYFFSWIHL